MSEKFVVKELPEIDKEQAEKGNCPWCLCKMNDATLHGGEGDQCPECFDEFI